MRPKIIYRVRLALAQLVAPPGADVHDPDDTRCPSDQDLLAGVFWHRFDHHAGGWWMDVVEDLADLVAVGLMTRDDNDDHWLTDAGERELARLWGSDRVPPWATGQGECDNHGLYDQFPGDRFGCPKCSREKPLPKHLQDAFTRRPFRLSR